MTAKKKSGNKQNNQGYSIEVDKIGDPRTVFVVVVKCCHGTAEQDKVGAELVEGVVDHAGVQVRKVEGHHLRDAGIAEGARTPLRPHHPNTISKGNKYLFMCNIMFCFVCSLL